MLHVPQILIFKLVQFKAKWDSVCTGLSSIHTDLHNMSFLPSDCWRAQNTSTTSVDRNIKFGQEDVSLSLCEKVSILYCLVWCCCYLHPETATSSWHTDLHCLSSSACLNKPQTLMNEQTRPLFVHFDITLLTISSTSWRNKQDPNTTNILVE